MAEVVCPVTGKKMARGVRSMTLEYQGEIVTFEMPGWYADGVEDGIHTGEDMKVSDRHLAKALKSGSRIARKTSDIPEEEAAQLIAELKKMITSAD